MAEELKVWAFGVLGFGVHRISPNLHTSQPPGPAPVGCTMRTGGGGSVVVVIVVDVFMA